MKLLALFLITFVSVSSFAKGIQFSPKSPLPKELQVAISNELSEICPQMMGEGVSIGELETKGTQNDEHELTYTTKFHVEKVGEDNYHYYPWATLYVQSVIDDKGNTGINYVKSPVCHSIDSSRN